MIRACVVWGLMALASGLCFGQDSDTEPPQLIEFDFEPKSIDVTTEPQVVTVTARITDNLVGVGEAFAFRPRIIFVSPVDDTLVQGTLLGRDAGTSLDGQYSASVQFPQFIASGTWRPQVVLLDTLRNTITLQPDDIASLGFPTALEATSIEDLMAPVVSESTVAPLVIDVSSGDAVVTLETRITDDLAGVRPLGSGGTEGSGTYAYADGPVNGVRHGFGGNASMVSGTPLDGVYRAEIRIPQHSAPGAWNVSVSAADSPEGSSGNWQLYENVATFSVVSATPDTAAPVLTGFSFSPTFIDTSAGPATVTVTVDFTDDLVGGVGLQPYFRSPSGSQYTASSDLTLISGDWNGGTVQFEMQFPQFSEDGTWKADITMEDMIGNQVILEAEDIAALGLPTDLIVIRPSLEVDDVIGTGGGTIADDTFGARAQVTFPPGLVAEDTSVAIDVFPDPLAVEMPAGIQGPGTFFVDINLDPVPAMPFAAPGLSVVLPLPEFVNPGTPIPLYYVDALTDLLEPMAGVSTGGAQVVGLVNADGLSATFDGISHLTVLVGLIPEATEIDIDIKPHGPLNLINAASHGLVPVGILSAKGFYAPWIVDRRTLTFGRSGDEDSLHHCEWLGRDVNRDRVPDLVCWFRISAAGFADGDTHGVLKGETFGQEALIGVDKVKPFEFSPWRHRH